MIVSKFRDLYIAKFVFFLAVSISFLLICLYLLLQDLSKEDFITTIALSFFSLCLFIYVLFEVFYIKKINILEKRIEFLIVLTKKTKTIYVSDIKSISREKVNGLSSRPGVKISDDYFQTKILTKNNSEFIISPHEYENYVEIIKEINFRLKSISAN